MDRLFTGKHLDSTGLYYYNARYYDPRIGRFISADTVVPDPMNPQALNMYSYCIGNPLKHINPTGKDYIVVGGACLKSEHKAAWEAQIRRHLTVKESERIVFLSDVGWGG